jgi:DNA polymerase (family 10)
MARSNDVVAGALQEFAELVAISGGDPYRARAYEKAARSVAGYHLDVDGLDEKALMAIPGVGRRIAEHIAELRATGHLGELDELRAQTPAGLRALLDVPGLGPKRAHQVYEELGISSVPELLEALRGQRLRHLRGWGVRSEENLHAAIRRLHEAGGRLPLAMALDLAEQLLASLETLPEVRRATAAGSLRRMRETVGDIDLLVAADDPSPVMDAFCSSPLVQRVLAHGPTRSAVVTTRGVQIDLRVVAPSSWGAALQYFTGSKAHNVALRELAARRGLKLSEYGLFSAEGGEALGATTEEEIYARLGLPWVPPTLREDRGEIQAALEDRLPRLVEVGDLRGDLHLHTNLTDGLASLEDMVAAAHARGYHYCAITDHAPLLSMQRMTTEKALEQRARLRSLEATSGMVLLHGSELNIQPDGSLDWDDEVLAGFDLLVASIHSHFDMPRAAMTQRIIRAMEHPNVHIIGHPTTRTLGHRPPIDFDTDAVFAAAARTGTALEINAFPDRLDLTDILARQARTHGVRFAINTDAHAVPHLAYMRFGVGTAQRAWIEAVEVINTYPLPELRRFLTKSPQVPPRGRASGLVVVPARTRPAPVHRRKDRRRERDQDRPGSDAGHGRLRLGTPEEHLAENGPQQPREVGDRVDDEVVDGDHSDDPAVLDERQPPEWVPVEDRHRLGEVGVGREGHQVGGHDGVHARVGRETAGDSPKDDVPVSDDPHRPVVVHDHDSTDHFAVHER